MVKLRIKELAQTRGFNISTLQRKADISMATARRYWYGTSDGREDGGPLTELHIDVLTSIASVLGVQVKDLFED